MAFVDEVTVFARGGKGGDGSAAVLREPYKPRGGPDGGDGGDGGDVVFEVSTGIHDLSVLANDPHLRAAAGASGGRNKRTGAAGADVVVQVPRGTRVEDEQGLVADLVEEGTRAVVARGGRGGRGSVSLATARDRVPRVAEAGEPGEDRRLSVELRTVADVGLVGLPNAGKSTLLSVLTAARPKVADYPFTTLSPNLGVAESDDRRFVVADVPGLIEGASEGRGLGHRFLRHVTRSRALVLVVDLSVADPSADLATLRGELEAYDPDLVRRSSIVVGTKLDLVPDADPQAVLGVGAIGVSAVSGEGIPVLRERLAALAAEAEAAAETQEEYVVLRP
ncbi:MAG: Obg family GTPase CgtA, partial [Actinomycetota bacterium]